MFSVFREKTISLKFHTQKKKFSKNKGKIKIFSDKVQGLYCQQDHTRYKKKKKTTSNRRKIISHGMLGAQKGIKNKDVNI